MGLKKLIGRLCPLKINASAMLQNAGMQMQRRLDTEVKDDCNRQKRQMQSSFCYYMYMMSACRM